MLIKKEKQVKKQKKISIKRSLIIGFSLLILVLITMLGIYQYFSMKDYLYKNKIEYLDSRFKNIDKEIIIGCTNEELIKNQSEYILNEISGEEICVAIIDWEGNIIDSKNIFRGISTEITKNPKMSIMSLPQFPKEEYLSIINSKTIFTGYYLITDKDKKKQMVIFRQLGEISHPSGLVQISTYLENTDNILYAQVKVYILAGIFVMIIGLILGGKLLEHLLKPLKKMTETLDTVDREKLGIRLETNSRQLEIDKLAENFNAMFERLEKSFKMQLENNECMKNFILDASHELRTPLTSMHGFIEVLQMGAAKNKEQLNMALDSMLMESNRLNKLVNNLLLIVKLEKNDAFEKNEEDIVKILEEIYPNLIVLTKDKIIHMNLGINLFSIVNKDQIKQIIFNLVQNAINHSNQGDVIEISASSEIIENHPYVKISIRDNGEGIPKENLENIFDRFYRVEKHRSRKNGGYGLGLSIVKSIVDNHNGKIEVTSEVGVGSEFKVYLIQKV